MRRPCRRNWREGHPWEKGAPTALQRCLRPWCKEIKRVFPEGKSVHEMSRQTKVCPGYGRCRLSVQYPRTFEVLPQEGRSDASRDGRDLHSLCNEPCQHRVGVLTGGKGGHNMWNQDLYFPPEKHKGQTTCVSSAAPACDGAYHYEPPPPPSRDVANPRCPSPHPLHGWFVS